MATRQTLPATIGIFEGTASEFGQRIHRLLDPHRRIRTRLDGRGKAVAFCCFLLLLLPATAPVATRAAEAEPSPPRVEQHSAPPSTPEIEPAKAAENEGDGPNPAQAPPIAWPKVLLGVIKDADGKPIAGARVRFDLEKIHEYSIGRWDESLDSQTQITPASGQYEFDASKLPRLTHRPFVLTLTCTAPGYADSKWWSWYTPSDTNVGEHLTDVTMPPGRVVRRRCLDPDGAPVPGAIVKMRHDYDPGVPSASLAWGPRETHEDGRFEFSIPRNSAGTFELLVIHRQWAPRRATLAGGSDDLGDLQLEPRCSRRGNRAQGRWHTGFRGGRCGGKRRLWATEEHGRSHHRRHADRCGGKVPAATPCRRVQDPPVSSRKCRQQSAAGLPRGRRVAAICLAGSDRTFRKRSAAARLSRGTDLKVRGTVRWADGRAVQRCEVKACYLPAGKGLGIWIGHTVTDAEGNYTIELPNPLEDVHISVSGKNDEHHVWHSAFPAENVVAKDKYEQTIQLGRSTADLDNMDWVLRPRER